MMDYSDRLRGIAVGAVVGDALGMPLEFQRPRPVYDLLTEMIDGALPAGTFTDDTEMALALAQSLLHRCPLDMDDLAERFTAWYRGGPSDIGIHTSQVLSKINAGTHWSKAAVEAQQADPRSSSNGSLMRCWPVTLAHWKDPVHLASDARAQSEMTHTHPDCVGACVLVNLILQQLVHRPEDMPPDAALRDALASALEQVPLDQDFRLAINLAPVRPRNELPNTGWVRHTLESAIWAVLTTRSFEEALVQAVNLGNDADTTGTVAGALAGALYGLGGFPARWKSALRGEYPLGSGQIWHLEDVISLADDLSALAG